jgi:cellulose biosynthesis protein BcsQ
VKVVATYSIKGGVGKTSAAVNLGVLAAADGLRTLIWDLDPQGAASFLLRIRPKVKGGARKLVRSKRDPLAVMKGTDFEGLDLLPADFSYRHLDLELDRRKRPERGVARVLEQLEDGYDLAILDCAPSISLVSESVFSAADLLLVPIVPSTLSLRTFEQLQGFLANADPEPDVLAFLSMVDRRRKLHRELTASLPATVPAVADVAIPAASVVELMGARRAPVVMTARRHPSAAAYRELWGKVHDRLRLTAR